MKLLLADDHTLFRDALLLYIERAAPDNEVTIACDLNEAMDIMAEETGFDLVLLDLRMPGMNGLEGMARMQQQYPGTRIAIISGTADRGQVQAALDMGAAAYFPKTLSGKEMIAAIRKVIAGEKFVPTEGSGDLMPSNYCGAPEPASAAIPAGAVRPDGAPVRFTPRERDVLVHLVHGASNKEIARALDLQVVTVKLHVRGICRKLDAKNRTQAALISRQMGLAGNSPIIRDSGISDNA
jgi:DNA-binding NarL/FixJ family response regulator